MASRKQEVAGGLSKAREQYGADAPSYRALERIMWNTLGTAGSVSHETIRSWHEKGIDPGHAPIEAMRVLAHVYQCELRDIHPLLDDRWERVLVLVGTSSEQDFSQFSCIAA